MKLNTFLCLPSFVFLVIGTQTVSIEAAPRIFGGLDASPGQFPYEVAVLEYGDPSCGGSIISENYIVTAAHCFYDDENKRLPAKSLSVRAGSIYCNRGGKIVNVSEVILHPHFVFIEVENDIGLLRLSEPLTFSELIQPIKIASNPPKKGASITISGWGAINTNLEYPDKLKYNKNLKAIPQPENGLLLVKHPEGFGGCSGDSGGPAIYKNKLVGVYCGGKECGDQFPDVYMLVSSFHDWLIKNSDLKTKSHKQ